ncbi:hypothetical protein JCM10212_001878 [Sporobolomyces blumeae]
MSSSTVHGANADRTPKTKAGQATQQTKPSTSLLNNTSVNIATAFRAATTTTTTTSKAAPGSAMRIGGRREDFPPLYGQRGAGHDERADESEEDEGPPRERDRDARSERGGSRQPTSAGKKRRKSTTKDPSFRPDGTESSEGVSEELDRGGGPASARKGKKRVKTRPEGQDEASDDPTTSSQSPRKSRKSVDPTYRPSNDPTFHAGDTSTTESSDDGLHSSKMRKRRSRSKSGGVGVDAIPRGIRDGQVWYGKGKKKRSSMGGRKGAGGSMAKNAEEVEEEGEANGRREGTVDREDEGQDGLGGMDEMNLGLEDRERERREREEGQPGGDEGDDITPPALPGASYFLRLKSPSPLTTPNPPQASTSTANGASTFKGAGWRLGSLSPFRSRSSASSVNPSPDPAFAAFDRSLPADVSTGLGPGSGPDDSRSTSGEGDSSLFRNSSYDYSEEERIVQALEAQRRLGQAQQAQPRQAQPTPSTQTRKNPLLSRLVGGSTPAQTPQTPIGQTPVPRPGAYPMTPASPVNGILRNRNGSTKNRMPAPPSMLGQSAAAGREGDDRLSSERGRRGREWGQKVGMWMRPVYERFERVRRKMNDPLLDWGKIWRCVAVVLGAIGLSILVWRINSETESTLPSTLPFLRSTAPSSFTPPSAPPDSLADLITRLSSLESAVGRISSDADSDRSRSSRDRSTVTSVSSQLADLEKSVEAGQKALQRGLDDLERKTGSNRDESDRMLQGMRGQLQGLAERVEQLNRAREGDSTNVAQVRQGLDSVSFDLDTLSSRLAQLSKDVEAGVADERTTSIVLAAIDKKLPGKVGVRLDQSGRLEIEPNFWKYLKDAFVDQRQLEKTVDSKVKAIEAASKKGAAGGGIFGSKADKDKARETVVVDKPPTWDHFLRANEASLRSWISSDLSSRTGTDAFVSKKTFLDLLHREIKALKRDFESKANENFEQMGRELLHKVAKQDEMRKKDEAYSARHRQGPISALDGPVTIKSTDGLNVTAVISHLVDSALLRYSKDVLARPDYALFTAGGRVIRSLTSPTYEPRPLGRGQKALAWITGTSAPTGRPPVTALHPDISPGSCWPFAGQRGQIGIQLSRRIVPSDITLEHISKDVALDGDVGSAPKDFEVWAVVEGQEHVRRLAEHRSAQLERKRNSAVSLEDQLNSDGAGDTAEDDLDLVTSVPPSPTHILLAQGTYDPFALTSPVQSFPVTAQARHLAIPVRVVVVKVLSNHGESDYTCLYRVRVSGTTESQLAASSAAP